MLFQRMNAFDSVYQLCEPFVILSINNQQKQVKQHAVSRLKVFTVFFYVTDTVWKKK